MHKSIGECIRYWASEFPDDVALVDDGGDVTWRELDLSTNRLARAYQSAGVSAGDFVSIILPNGRELYQASIAAWKLGATPQPISGRMPPLERAAILEVVSPKLVVGGDDDIGSGIAQLDSGFTPDSSLSDGPLEQVIAPHWKAVASGGSTGKPKIIVSKEPGYFDPLAPDYCMTVRGTHLVAGPLYHNAPFLFSSRALFCGSKLVVMSKFDAERALQLIEEHKVTWTLMVPTMMHRIWRLPPSTRSRYDVSSLRTILHTAAPCPPWLKANWVEWLGADVVEEVYGGTEACGSTWISGADWVRKPGSVGKAMSGCAIRVVDEAGEPVPAGVVGEVFMRPDAGPGASYFYLGAESKRSTDGWETIGDMGHLDEEGFLFLADRRTDLIISGGANIYPAEVEAAIDAFPGVRSNAVIGLPDEDLGNRVHAVIETVDNLNIEALREHLAERLVRYKIPRSFEFTVERVRDEAGKVRRAALRAERMTTSPAPDANVASAS